VIGYQEEAGSRAAIDEVTPQHATLPSAAVKHSALTWLLVGTYVAGLALRLYCLDCHGFWGDEINSLDGALLGIPAIFTERFGWVANQTPFHYLLLWLTAQPVDPTTDATLVRLPSALAGAFTPLVVYGLGREMFGRAQGALTAGLIAFSATHLTYSQDLRLYSMLVFLTSLSVYCLLLAERTNSARWWAAFTAAATANVLNAYLALILVMPGLSLYLAWVLWNLWRKRSNARRPLLYAAASIFAVASVSGALLLEMARAPRTSPDLSRFSPATALTSVLELVAWFTRFGLDGQPERLLQLLFLLLGLVGLYGGLRSRSAQSGAVLLCILFLLAPSAMLALFSTTSVVFQRYAIFAMPFYFLLVSHGLALLFAGARKVDSRLLPGKLMRVGAWALAILVVGVSLYGVYTYHSPDGHIKVAYRPDFRGAAGYLSLRAQPEDTIVFVDDPGLGYTISNFYWQWTSPAPAYDARDPSLFEREARGDIYWVVSMEKLDVLSAISSSVHGWAETAHFERVVVLREQPKESILKSMARLVGKLEATTPGYQPIVTLQGCLHQARGDIGRAAETYRSAGTYFPVGDDYLRTAQGFSRLGLEKKAWREALISKFWQPGKPAVHRWLSETLAGNGYPTASQVEAQIVEALETIR
jgi:hypothetical protein